MGCIHTGSVLTAQAGDKVSIDYTGSLENGAVFDTSIQAEAQRAGLPARPSYSPIEFTLGGGQVIPGFNDAVIGMKEGENKTVTIPAAQGYGERSPDKIVEVPLESIDGGNVTIGGTLTGADGTAGVVIGVDNSTATIDLNHPLAGKTLVFKITLVKVTRAQQ